MLYGNEKDKTEGQRQECRVIYILLTTRATVARNQELSEDQTPRGWESQHGAFSAPQCSGKGGLPDTVLREMLQALKKTTTSTEP